LDRHYPKALGGRTVPHRHVYELVFSMLIYYDVKEDGLGWLIPFELPNIIYLLQVMYAWTTFVSR
jgi:hypothetical protein